MASLIANIIDSYRDIMENQSHPLNKDWLWMSSPFPTIWIIFAYLIFVTKLGPKLMEHREPFKLTNIITYYNGMQMIISAYLFYHLCFTLGWLTDMQWFCQLPDTTRTPRALAIAHIAWFCYISKLLELFDTVFFVLRKKYNQISNLHLIHHSMVPLLVWVGTKFSPGGSISFFEFLNSFVHLVMYGYYLLAALGPHMQKYLWWKRYLTIMQIVQFVLIIAHLAVQIFIKNCAIPSVLLYTSLSFMIVILVLFMHFYRLEYNVRARQQQEKELHKRK